MPHAAHPTWGIFVIFDYPISNIPRILNIIGRDRDNHMTNIDLSGQVAVVTGGSRGIGRQIARDLAAAGATVVVTARSEEKLAETVTLITDAGGTAHAYPLDVSDTKSVAATMAKIADEIGAVDILINNAGIANGGQLPWQMSVESWWQVMEVNVLGVFAACHAVIPSMLERGSGRIINVGSYIGFYSVPPATAYSVSKAALASLSNNLAIATEGTGVSVFCISPGLVKTDMTDNPDFDDTPDDAWVPIEKSGELCVQLASGKADVLSGRFIHAKTDDLDDLINRADEITEKNLHVLTYANWVADSPFDS